MPKGSDWFNFVYVNMAYLALIFVISIFLRIQEIRKNWPKYRCNPVYMPLADDMGKNFAFCVQNMQSNYMGYLLQPIWYLLSSMQNMATTTMGSLQDFRKMIAFIRSSFGDILGSIMGIFVNLVIQFQKIILAIKDSIAKIAGVLVTFMYTMDGTRMTLGSIWSGPPGQMTRALCFCPNTLVVLQDGTRLPMKEVDLGHVLYDGSNVIGTMRIANENEEALYQVPTIATATTETTPTHVLVTGAHYLRNEVTGKYVRVCDHPDAILTNITIPVFACLITDDHHIHIDGLNFWDWDDDMIPDNLR